MIDCGQPRAPQLQKARHVLCVCASTSRVRLCDLVPTWWCTKTSANTCAGALLLLSGALMDDWCHPPPSRLDDRPPTARGWAQLKIPQPPPVETKVMHEQPHNHQTVYRCVATERFHSVAASSYGNVESGRVCSHHAARSTWSPGATRSKPIRCNNNDIARRSYRLGCQIRPHRRDIWGNGS